MSVPRSFLKLTLVIEREFCELIRETAVIAEDRDIIATPALWDMVKALYADDQPWTLRRIPKRKGFRTIHAPKDPLMTLSRGILHHILRRIPVHKAVHGSEPRSSVITNARVHAGFAKALYNLDLKDAFPSIDRKRLRANLGPKIRDVLLSATSLDEEESDILVAVLLDLMIVDKRLPQGFPTSPAVLNIVMMPVDRAISRYLRELEAETDSSWRYSRYVDDLTISTNQDHIPENVRRELRRIIRGEGWKINATKVAYFGDAEPGDPEHSTKAPVVTGLVIHTDGRLTVPRWKLKYWRAFMDKCLGQDELTLEQREQVTGIASFLNMVYDGELPSAVRQPYLDLKTKFGIRDAQTRRERFPDRGMDSGV